MLALTVAFCLSGLGAAIGRIEFEFVPYLDRVVAIGLPGGGHGNMLVGTLDIGGRFTPLPDAEAYMTGGSKIFHLLNCGDPHFTYELRGEVLVPGTICSGRSFVPQPGGAAVRFQDYHPLRAKGPIWNLPGFFRSARAV